MSLMVLFVWMSASAGGAELRAPTGALGNGLSRDPEQRGRVYLELSAFATRFSTAFLETRSQAFPLLLGGGVKLADGLELELRVPVAMGGTRAELAGVAGASTGGIGLGNLELGVNTLIETDDVLIKVGGAFAAGPWTRDPDDDLAMVLYLAWVTRYHELGLWGSGLLSITTPSRLEYAPIPELQISADALVGLYIPTTDDFDLELGLSLAPGVSWTAEAAQVGARIPLWWMPSASGDNAQLSFEPFLVIPIGQAFVNGRFTVNLDQPLGFSFEEGEVWALSVGGGVAL